MTTFLFRIWREHASIEKDKLSLNATVGANATESVTEGGVVVPRVSS